jgi:hypothetical protein
LPGLSPIAPRGHTHRTPSDGSKPESDSARISGGGVRTKILYFNPESVPDKYGHIIWQRGHDVATASSGADALAMMRSEIFDALVMDCAPDTLDILNFTAKARGLQPSLAVFLVDEWAMSLQPAWKNLDMC